MFIFIIFLKSSCGLLNRKLFIYINGITIGITKGIIMRVATKRWGEVSIKKQGYEKNKFDKTKSFSIQKSKHEYTVEQLYELFALVVNRSERNTFEDLKKILVKS